MKRTKPMKKPIISLLIILAVFVALVAAVTPVLAYYIRGTGDLQNGEYTPAEPSEPTIQITDINDETKGKQISVTVEDEGYPVFVRASIVVTWVMTVSGEEVVYYEQPTPGNNGDYTISLDTNWEQKGNFYYYTTPILDTEENESTEILFFTCTRLKQKPDNVPSTAPTTEFVLRVEIAVQTVQAIGATDKDNTPAWKDAWGIDKIMP